MRLHRLKCLLQRDKLALLFVAGHFVSTPSSLGIAEQTAYDLDTVTLFLSALLNVLCLMSDGDPFPKLQHIVAVLGESLNLSLRTMSRVLSLFLIALFGRCRLYRGEPMCSGRTVKRPRHHALNAIGFNILRAIQFPPFPQMIMDIVFSLNVGSEVVIVHQIQIAVVCQLGFIVLVVRLSPTPL
jgi:hypothetical protein